jgi:hypothetical protein
MISILSSATIRAQEVRVFDNVGFHTTNQFFPPASVPRRDNAAPGRGG